MLDQVRPEGGTPGMLWLARELAGAEKASRAVVSQTHPSGGSGLVVAMHGRVEESRMPQWRNGRAQIMLHSFVYILPRECTWPEERTMGFFFPPSMGSTMATR